MASLLLSDIDLIFFPLAVLLLAWSPLEELFMFFMPFCEAVGA